jgi:hypothetical protein
MITRLDRCPSNHHCRYSRLPCCSPGSSWAARRSDIMVQGPEQSDLPFSVLRQAMGYFQRRVPWPGGRGEACSAALLLLLLSVLHVGSGLGMTGLAQGEVS